ncbi:restriction endonuclease subunit S [Glaesserella parasuis]|uniref:restriction endonuclease subunit S n=1 Tax=Glaesserella parasuis TaxID=738 RepID=UPI0024368AA5|nr:restriction endonuclease subunit S [Glaesserella parasuis]MDG6230524.1 restriction endonuclease subunit S [Glaesserella parasuis]
MSSWELKKLSEVADIIGGATPKSDVDEYFNGDIPWITPKDLSGYKNRYISKGERNITKLGLENSSAKLLPKGAVLFTSRAPIGYVAIADNEVSTNQGFKSLVLKDGNIPEFFYYLLKHNIPLFEARATGSTFKEVSGQVVKNTELLIPSIDIQKKIVDLVSPLDEKIELNTQINQTLEQIAQTIFKSWFIDFDPVHAKANALANGQTAKQATQAAMAVISGKNTQELHRLQTANPEQYQQLWEIAEAFPSGFDEEGVPRGWEERYLKDVCNIVYGKGLPKNKLTEKGFYVFGANGVIGFYDSYTYEKPQVLIGCRGTVGQVTLSYPYSFVTNNSLVIEYENSCVSMYYLDKYLSDINLKEISSGSVQPQITIQNMSKVKILLPNIKILNFYSEKVKEIYDKRLHHFYENQSLSKVRDLLLPKLLSGEIGNE